MLWRGALTNQKWESLRVRRSWPVGDERTYYTGLETHDWALLLAGTWCSCCIWWYAFPGCLFFFHVLLIEHQRRSWKYKRKTSILTIANYLSVFAFAPILVPGPYNEVGFVIASQWRLRCFLGKFDGSDGIMILPFQSDGAMKIARRFLERPGPLDTNRPGVQWWDSAIMSSLLGAPSRSFSDIGWLLVFFSLSFLVAVGANACRSCAWCLLLLPSLEDDDCPLECSAGDNLIYTKYIFLFITIFLFSWKTSMCSYFEMAFPDSCGGFVFERPSSMSIKFRGLEFLWAVSRTWPLYSYSMLILCVDPWTCLCSAMTTRVSHVVTFRLDMARVTMIIHTKYTELTTVFAFVGLDSKRCYCCFWFHDPLINGMNIMEHRIYLYVYRNSRWFLYALFGMIPSAAFPGFTIDWW